MKGTLKESHSASLPSKIVSKFYARLILNPFTLDTNRFEKKVNEHGSNTSSAVRVWPRLAVNL